ncbi:hypothetical protein J8273_1773 [Carpediemonas membranifera]|uniref:Uncharacterized protein n=1 Tax=Carpediemonas membranifera TaxID=201153 RepID=A0A8J6B0L9_9EUKA|nr:hypothetical protein J8273_1773 [Carpediemonas membranifera]|eukprot:KAG9396755.1 hypothetical protein J8273_1773 [Carpediemonas membranifera]
MRAVPADLEGLRGILRLCTCGGRVVWRLEDAWHNQGSITGLWRSPRYGESSVQGSGMVNGALCWQIGRAMWRSNAFQHFDMSRIKGIC